MWCVLGQSRLQSETLSHIKQNKIYFHHGSEAGTLRNTLALLGLQWAAQTGNELLITSIYFCVLLFGGCSLWTQRVFNPKEGILGGYRSVVGLSLALDFLGALIRGQRELQLWSLSRSGSAKGWPWDGPCISKELRFQFLGTWLSSLKGCNY